MRAFIIFTFVVAIGLVQASPYQWKQDQQDQDRSKRQRPYAPAPVVPVSAPLEVGPAAYTYQWEVADEDASAFYGHGEKRDGVVTSGSYFVLLPDGRRQRVDYTVTGDSGYVATVTYD